MAKSIKVNFIYNLVNVISGLLFPLITFPYASRMVLADGIGQVQFFNSIINYVVILTGLGIPMYAVREIAKVRDDVKELTKTTVEIILLNLLLNVIGYIIIAILCLTVIKIQVNIPLFLLLSTSIILTTIGCPWFYNGVEDFKYITIRGLIIKVISVILLFILVKGPEDLMWYGFYTVLGSIGNYILNFFRLRKYIQPSTVSFTELNLVRHVKPALEIFILNLITSIYVSLDSVMVGFLKDTTSVGYYTAATKLSHMLLMAVTSLGTVMLPRSANLIKNGQIEEFAALAKKSYDFILMMAFPISAGLMVLAPTLIYLFSGVSFTPAVLTLQIISPIIVAIGVSNLIGIQVLYPLDKVKIVTISTCVGAIINFALNSILIPLYAQNGAAISTVVAESSVTLTQIIIARKYIPFNLFDKKSLVYIISTAVMFVVCAVIMNFDFSDVLNIFIVPIAGVLVYGSLLLLFKDELAFEMINVIKKKIFKK